MVNPIWTLLIVGTGGYDDLAELVAVCDIVKERADSAAERLGVKAYYKLADMIDGEPDLDIVDVGTGGYENGSWHYEPTMEALDNGKHVLVRNRFPMTSDRHERWSRKPQKKTSISVVT